MAATAFYAGFAGPASDYGRRLARLECWGATVARTSPPRSTRSSPMPGSGPCCANVRMRGFEQAFGCIILEGYGLSETSPVASFNHPDKVRKPGSIGIPVEGVQMRVVDDDGAELPVGEIGEIVIHGHNVMKGYWGNPEATAETITDGWLRTGDLARVDEDGYFYIVDRKKDLIIRGGFNVYPREIEEVSMSSRPSPKPP